MKRITSWPWLRVFAILALLSFAGCSKNESTPTEKKEKPTAKSVPKNNFEAVTAELDPGGELYLYVGTEQWMHGLSAKIGDWSQLLNGIPDLRDESRTNIGVALTVVTNLVQASGLEQVKGFGLSSVPHEDGLHRSKSFLYSGENNSSGFLWNLFGNAPHELHGLNLLPTNTAVAGFWT